MDDTLISPVQYLPKRHATMMLQGTSGFCSLINKSIYKLAWKEAGDQLLISEKNNRPGKL